MKTFFGEKNSSLWQNLCFKILTHPVMDVPCDIGSSQRQHHSTGAQASKHTHTHTHTSEDEQKQALLMLCNM
jgi:hypothetical protein